ncbi:MAG: hypothetical protein ACKO0N_02860 [Planctomycetota bacterium]
MKLSLSPQSWLPLCLLLGSLGWMSGCAVGVPAQSLALSGNGKGAAGTITGRRNLAGAEMTQRAPATKYPARRTQELTADSVKNGSPAVKPTQLDGIAAGEAVPVVKATGDLPKGLASKSNLSQSARNSRQLAESQSAASPIGRSNQSAGLEAGSANSGTNLSLSDSPIPNPLRSTNSNRPKSAAANSMNRSGQNLQQSKVQTVGYQEEIPIIAGEQIPKNPENITRLAMLEEPALAEPTPASVLEPGESAPTADPVITESVPAEVAEGEGQLPWDEYEPQQEVPIVQPMGTPGAGNAMNPTAPVANAQGHYQQGTAVFGQVLNEPQQTASQRAIQLLDENQRLREEMKTKLKELENAQAKLKQQDELWARARQEFLEVRGVVDNLTRENSLLKMQIEKLEGEKVELARQYQSLMQTVEQTLDDLLLKAITQPPEGNPPGTTPATIPVIPPAAAPVTQPPVAPPIVNGQQASALLKSPQ